MRNFTWNRFPIKNLLIDSLLTLIVESTYLNRDMCKFELSQKDESRWQSTDSSKAYRNTSAFKWSSVKSHWNDFPSDVFDISKIALDVKIKSSIQLISKADTLPAQFIRFYVWKIRLSVKISIFTAGNVCILHHVFFLKNFVDCCVLLSFRNQDKRLVYSSS